MTGDRHRPKSAEHRAKIGAAQRGRKHSPETVAKLRAAWTPELREAARAFRTLDLTGHKYGRLLVMRRTEVAMYGRSNTWVCECDCGNVCECTTGTLRGGRQSCGCLRADRLTAANKSRALRPYEYIFTGLKTSTQRRGLDFSLTYEDVLAFVSVTSCFYCDAPVLWFPVSGQSRRTNLDRKDNALGYHRDNLVVCCWECNNAKSDRYTFEEWQAMAAALREVRGR